MIRDDRMQDEDTSGLCGRSSWTGSGVLTVNIHELIDQSHGVIFNQRNLVFVFIAMHPIVMHDAIELKGLGTVATYSHDPHDGPDNTVNFTKVLRER